MFFTSFTDVYIGTLKKYGTFVGRATRKEYWLFVLGNILIVAGVSIVLGFLNGLAASIFLLNHFFMILGWLLLLTFWIYGLALIVPSLAVTVRRLHDSDRSAWWLLIGPVPFVGGIILLILLLMSGTVGENKYGPVV